MIYQALKWLVDWLKTSYKCPDCNEWVSESDIDIVGAAWNTVNFDIICHKCGKHWIVKSQLVMLDANGLSEMKHSIENIKNKLNPSSTTTQIADTEIVSLDKELKEKQINVSDLFE